MVSIKDRKILRQMFSHYDYVMTTAQLSKEKLYYRKCWKNFLLTQNFPVNPMRLHQKNVVSIKSFGIRNYPLYCPKCKKESLIDVKRLQVTVIKEPDAKTQSR